MNKKDLVSRVSEILRENDLRKPVKIKKHKFQIIDEEGNTAHFTVKRADKRVLYTVDDIGNIIDACLEAVLESVRRGEEVNIRGFGTLGLHYRAARRTKQPGTEDWYEIDAHYIPPYQNSYSSRLNLLQGFAHHTICSQNILNQATLSPHRPRHKTARYIQELFPMI